MDGLLTSHGIRDVFHYVPLHYVLFIARSKYLFSKNELREAGYQDSHFRRTSRHQDELRGFSEYVHLTLDRLPPILKAKLAGGFPHFEVRISARDVEQGTVHLCRFNIAKTRYLRRGSSRGSMESSSNGRYHGTKQIPTAETDAGCGMLLKANLSRNMIEVLVPSKLPLTDNTRLIFFRQADLDLAVDLLRSTRVAWQLDIVRDFSYVAAPRYVTTVMQFLERAAADPDWRGDGLDFDRV